MDFSTHQVVSGSPTIPPTVSDSRTTALLAIYEQICISHQAIDEFRMKLLGLLPLASLAGIFLLSKSDSVLDLIGGPSKTSAENPLIAFIAIFAATFTLALFVYEIRGILRCHGLILEGKAIEDELGIHGQFSVCNQQHKSATGESATGESVNGEGTKKVSAKSDTTNYVFNAKVAACFTYSLVFAAWIFLALHRGFGLEIPHCTLSALLVGLILGGGVHWIIDKRIAA